MILEKKSEGIKKFIKKVEKKVGVLVEVKTIYICVECHLFRKTDRLPN